MATVQPPLARHYHERTKYSPETLSRHAGDLDFSQRPAIYKDYRLGQTFSLKEYMEEESGASSPRVRPPQEKQQWQRLSRLLYLSYGITGVVNYPGQPFYMRSAPSAGGLYPAEVYLISRADSLLPAGLYNYQVKNHSLIQFWQSNVWSKLQEACLWHPSLESTRLVVVITAIFFRSSWRYRDRAYRRICLDSGHLIGNLELAANLNDYHLHLIGGFLDEQMNDLLYLDGRQESTLAIAPLADLLEVEQNLPSLRTTLPSPICIDYPDLSDGELLTYIHQKSRITSTENIYRQPEPEDPPEEEQSDKYNFPFSSKISLEAQPMDWQGGLKGLETAILRRRSTRDYSGQSIHLHQLAALLSFTYHPEYYQEQGLDSYPDFFDLSAIETFIAVSDVAGLEEGCYYYAPQAHELRQIRFKNFREELHYLCLNQDLGRDAAAVIFHTADLESAITTHGERAYRYLHLDAGHLGQRLNLAATHLNLGVSGIGGFFDDQVNELLGIPLEEAVLYITTLGQPK
ncbi:SagB/ThcOx family dehydrogenase [Candidatus Synechococcus calcipolaris G9]|uniref:SagB/ThcOx family dehydrogenase n=1 Tax=Candidatus Synechococcus calcipolaris G9 TaxID=1497997 RepID=A0ABT6EXI5_9SYNE|nr:SagB/ThcOx family dehydrogenase [Candidatus Synechococcus calcipolaris]MDG2990522.1 SagB/ThcOx family dehydrogenase [Candidatus Synechococcus calcipolaris G9]